jgi:hypothetical protein
MEPAVQAATVADSSRPKAVLGTLEINADKPTSADRHQHGRNGCLEES